MENKDYSFYSDDNPKNEADSLQGDFVAEPPKKKRKKKTWIVAVSLISVFVVLAGVAAFLFVPISLMDPIENTFEAMFFDTAAIDSLMSTYEKKGEQVDITVDIPTDVSNLAQRIYLNLEGTTVGKGNKAKTEATLTIAGDSKKNGAVYNIYVDDDIIALAGLLADEDSYVSLPRKNVKKLADDSIFNPKGDSTYKIQDKTDYQDLVSLLQAVSTDAPSKDEEEELAAFDAALDRIFAAIEEELESETKLAFSEEGFALSKTTVLSLDSAAIEKILKTIAKEADNNDTLNELITFTDDEGNKQTLSEKCKLLKKNAEEQKPTFTLSYTVEKGRFTEISLTLKEKNEWEKNTTNELVVTFFYEDFENGFDYEMTKTTEKTALHTVRVDKGSYRKEIHKHETEATLKTESSILINGKSLPTETADLEIVFTYEDSEDWTLKWSDSNSKDSTKVFGTLLVNPKKGTCSFTLDGYSKGKTNVKETLVTVSVETPKADAKVTTPEHTPLLEMSEKEFEDFFQSISFKKPVTVVDGWLGAPMLESSLRLTTAGEFAPIWDPDDVIEEAQTCYRAYMNSNTSIQAYIYYEKYDIYFLFSRGNAEIVYELTDSHKRTFREAEVKNGSLNFK